MPKELREGEIAIKVYLDSGANIHSKNKQVMHIDKEDWEEMSMQEKHEAVLEFFVTRGFDYGWEDE